MKKLISLILIVSMCFACTVPDIADAANETSGTTALTYSVTSSYTITIPVGITVTNGVGKDTYGVNAGSLISGGQKITFTITGATNYDAAGSKFRMVNDGDSSVYLGYTITKPGTPNPVSVVKDTAFLEATAQEANAGKSVELTYTTEAAVIAGDYTDTITIAVALVAAP